MDTPNTPSHAPAAPEFTIEKLPPPRRGLFGIVLLVIVVLIVLALIGGFLPRFFHQREVKQESAELAVPTVSFITPTPAAATYNLVLPADIQPFSAATIYARIDGYLKRWNVDLGSRVKAGDLLAEIDAPELDQQLNNARARLTQAQASLTLAQTTAKRYTELRQRSVVAQQDADEKNADQATNEANVKGAQATVGQLEQQQSFEKVTAPFDGMITERFVDVGALIHANGAPPLFSIAQPDHLRVYARVPQSDARAMKSGVHAEVFIAELPGRSFPAEIVRTAGVVDENSRTLLVELSLENLKGEIFAGSHAEVHFAIKSDSARYTIPSNAMLFRAEGVQVGIVKPDGSVEVRSVKVGRDFGRTLEILTGVEPADHIIINPSDSLQTGLRVKATPVKPDNAAPAKSASAPDKK